MGSFANSLHVRSGDLAAVAASVRKALRSESFEPTDEPLDADARWGMSASLRGIHISEPRQGWVAVLENDPLSSVTLAGELSQLLKSHAIQFFVNDSDSWHYQLFYKGRQIDAFDSSPDADEGDWSEGPLDDVLSSGSLAGIEQAVRGKAQEFERQLMAEMPVEVQEIYRKMQSGDATQAETQQYLQWMNAELPKRMGDMQRMIGEAMQGLAPGTNRRHGAANGEEESRRRATSPSAEEEQRLRPHVEQLQPLLAAGTPADLILELLGRQATFAEETLAEFLPLLGIAPVYAHLSYRYLEDFSESELASQSVRMAEHLRFRSGFADD
jgi:hypothetical protein